VIRKPLKVLVCLCLLAILATASISWGYNGTGLPSGTGIQGDALSADPSVQIAPPVRSGNRTMAPGRSPSVSTQKHYPVTHSPRSTSSGGSKSSSAAIYYPSAIRSANIPIAYGRAGTAMDNPGVAYPVQASGQGGGVGSMCGPFAPSGMTLGYSSCVPVLPRIGAKQFQAEAMAWYAKLNSSTVQWGAIPGGWLGQELDLHNDLGLRKNEYIPEFSGRCQIKCNWGLRYNFMPIHRRDNFFNTKPFFFGNLIWAAGLGLLTEWDRNIHNWELVYDWFQAPHAVSSVFAGFRYVDDKLRLSYPPLAPFGVSRTRSQTIHLATAGGSIDRVISRVGGCATASIHCRGAIQFLEGYVGWDATGMGRVTVPMCQGRYGYLEAGWKWMVLECGHQSNQDKTSLDGAIAAAGLIF
jgi:hypothetical protein